MARFASLLAVACALLAPGCGLALDFSPPDDGGSGLDAGPIDAAHADASFDGAVDDASLDGSLPFDADVDAAMVACVSNTDCPVGTDCVHPCDGGEAHCIATPPCDDVEVCGCDGEIHDSLCEAHAAGVEATADLSVCPQVCTADRLSCVAGESCVSCPGELPTCVIADDFCLATPVCGCDGRTYDSNCAAIAAGVRTYDDGACHDCTSSRDCGMDSYCAREDCNAERGTCAPLPTDRVPLVCGCSGRRYFTERLALLHEGLIGSCDPCPRVGSMCCADSDDCGPAQACVNADPTAGACIGGGSCVSLEELRVVGTCWTDADCDAGALCLDASICACGASCLLPDSPGHCVTPRP